MFEIITTINSHHSKAFVFIEPLLKVQRGQSLGNSSQRDALCLLKIKFLSILCTSESFKRLFAYDCFHESISMPSRRHENKESKATVLNYIQALKLRFLFYSTTFLNKCYKMCLVPSQYLLACLFACLYVTLWEWFKEIHRMLQRGVSLKFVWAIEVCWIFLVLHAFLQPPGASSR